MDVSTEPTRNYVPIRLVLGSIVGLWLAYFVLQTIRSFILEFDFQGGLAMHRLLVTAIGMAITFAFYLILRVVENRSLGLKLAVGLLAGVPVALALAQTNAMVFAEYNKKFLEKSEEREGVRIRRDETGNILVDVARPQGQDGEEEAPQDKERDVATFTALQQLFDIALSRYFMVLAWAAMYFALAAGEKARAAERREGEFRRAANAAELRSLRYQVNPHFLFNTFNSLSALVVTEQTERAESMIQQISSFYRQSLADDPTGDVTLDEEFRLQRLYLDIEAVRFPDRLRIAVELPSGLENASVPGMILQPLVENSVRYAVAAVSHPVTISISAREEYGRLVITVRDDGPGPENGSNGDHGHGIGLTNVRQRLEARFGKEATLVSGAAETGYASIIRLPLVWHGR